MHSAAQIALVGRYGKGPTELAEALEYLETVEPLLGEAVLSAGQVTVDRHNGCMNNHGARVLYAIVTGATVARDVGKLVDLAHCDGWDVCVIASPHGHRFIDVDALAAKTGYPVRSQYKEPDAPDVLPAAEAMIVAPITSNSLAKWAAGISDTLPLGLLVEAVGLGLPVVAVPFVNRALISFPPVAEAARKLSEWGVAVLSEDPPHEPSSGGAARERFPWEGAWHALLEHPRLAIGT